MGSKIAEALLKAQQACSWVEKTGRLEVGRGSIPVLETPYLIAEVRGHLLGAGVVVSTSVDRVEDVDRVELMTGGEKKQIWRTCRVFLRVTFTHAESGEHLVVTHVGQASDNGPAAIAKASTIALRYALQQCLLIPAGDDPEKGEQQADGYQPTRQESRQQRPQQQRQQQPQQPQRQAQQKPPRQPAPAGGSEAYGALLDNQAKRVNTFAGQSITSAYAIWDELSKRTDGDITEDDVLRHVDGLVDSVDLRANPYAAAVRHYAKELCKVYRSPRHLAERMIGTKVKEIVAEQGIKQPTQETAAAAHALVCAELDKAAVRRAVA